MPHDRIVKIAVLAIISAITVAIHYGLLLEFFFGHEEWCHAVHSRFCYIPIVIAATWFGLRGGLIAASGISLLVIPFILGYVSSHMSLSDELVEIVFYYGIGILVGALVDRESRARRHREELSRQLALSHQLSLMGQMAAGVAHEIKNPLASIKGGVEILGDPNTTVADRAEFSGIVTSEIRRIDGTIRGFLDLARPLTIQPVQLDLSATLQASLRQFETEPQAKQCRISAELSPGVRIWGDPERLHQVILNLLLNAAESCTSEGDILVRLHRIGDTARVVVEDDGPGIPPDQRDKVFEPFFSTKARGSGLGLSIVKSIVEAHGGSIALESPAHGTRFVVSLPLKGPAA